ncbi:hypothetical protein VKS41_003146 [Umbelopsis sp. WA50703]
MSNTDNWSASKYDQNANFVPLLGSIILDMLAAQPDETILDLGCGDGILTKKLEGLCKRVVGIDASENMIKKAREIGCKDARVVDGHDIAGWFAKENVKQDIGGKFDAVFSNAALHWMTEPKKVIAGVNQVLKPGGRFVGEFGGYMNVADVHGALITALNRRGKDGRSFSPWFFPSDQYYKTLLEEQGFKVETISLNPRPTQLPTDVAGWIDTFGFSFLAALDTEEERRDMVHEIVEHLRPTNQREDGVWTVMYVRCRFIAYKQ